MPDRPPFPIPEVIDPPKMCLQLCIPNDQTWKRVINGLLSELGQWYNWQRDEARSGKQLAQVWRQIYNDIDWSEMSCCCPETAPLQYRWTEDGHYQSSPDGVTWTDAPTSDPRYSVPLAPPVYGSGDALKCQYADGVVNVMKTQFVEAIEVGDDLQTIIGIIIGVLSAILGTVAAPLVYQIMAVVAGAILGATIEAFQDAFTTEVWDRLRCNIRDNMASDGSFSQANVDAIYSRINSDETGIAALTLKQAVAAFGTQGMTNAARTGNGAVDADCEACDPPTCFTMYEVFCEVGEIISVEDDHIVVECGASSITGGFGIALTTNDSLLGCYVIDVTTMEGVSFTPLSAWREVGGGVPGCGDAFGNANVYCNRANTFVLYGLSDGEQLKIYLSDEPCPP